MTAIHDSILDVIGNTPVVQLNRIGRDYACDIVAKCEFLNPGGSVKDRIGVRMLLEAEKAGHIKRILNLAIRLLSQHQAIQVLGYVSQSF